MTLDILTQAADLAELRVCEIQAEQAARSDHARRVLTEQCADALHRVLALPITPAQLGWDETIGYPYALIEGVKLRGGITSQYPYPALPWAEVLWRGRWVEIQSLADLAWLGKEGDWR